MIVAMNAARLALVVALSGGADIALAHHGSAISYDLSKQVTLTGVVTEWVWKNPHCFVMFDVTDEQGRAVVWGAETHPTTFLVRNEVKGVPVPLSATSIKPGDRVTVTLFPSRVGTPRGLLAKLVDAEGKAVVVVQHLASADERSTLGDYEGGTDDVFRLSEKDALALVGRHHCGLETRRVGYVDFVGRANNRRSR